MDTSNLFQDPDQFLFEFEPPNATFVEMSREAYRRSLFCDGRIVAASDKKSAIPYKKLIDQHKASKLAPPNVSFIFHTGHCGSTLLAKALEVTEDILVCREPLALRQLGVEYSFDIAGRTIPEDWSDRLRLVVALLGRQYEENSRVIVKANAPVNFIIPEVLAETAARPPLFLYFPLEDYVLAWMRSPNHRNWLVGLCNETQLGIQKYAPLESNLSVAKVAGSLWFAQMMCFAEAMEQTPGAVSLSGEEFFNNPATVMRAIFKHFDIQNSEEQFRAIIRGNLFSTYSKNPDHAFDNSMRLSRKENLRVIIHNEIKEAHDWIKSFGGDKQLPKSLASPLCGDAPDLLSTF